MSENFEFFKEDSKIFLNSKKGSKFFEFAGFEYSGVICNINPVVVLSN